MQPTVSNFQPAIQFSIIVGLEGNTTLQMIKYYIMIILIWIDISFYYQKNITVIDIRIIIKTW